MITRGITTSIAHYWAHVCPLDAMIYWYPRRQMLGLIESCHEAPIRSAVGRLVPIVPNLFANGGCIRYVEPGYRWFDQWNWQKASSDLEVGAWAEACFARAVRERLLLLPVQISRYYGDVSEQVQGKDFACSLGADCVDIEVKYDGRGGTWGTGNLFVQTHEGTTSGGDRHKFQARNAHREGNPGLPA